MNDSRLFRTGCHAVSLFLFVYFGSALPAAHAGVNAWTTEGPYGGHVRAMAVDSAGSIYAGLFGRGLFKSSDGGMHWTPINSGLSDPFVNAIVIDGSGAIYVGTGEEQPGSTTVAGARIFKSTNGGSTWNAVFSSPGEHVCVTELAIDGGGIVYAGTSGSGILFSQNDGPWTPYNAGLTNLDISALAAHGSTIYAGTAGGGVFKLVSAQSGLPSWAPVNSNLTDMFINALSADAYGTLYAGTNNGVFFTNNGGASWSQFGIWLPGLCVNSLAIESSGLVYAGACALGVAKSTILMPFFPTIIPWSPANEGLFNSNVIALAMDNSGTIYAGTDGSGIYKSTDGGVSWEGVSAGIPHLDVWALAVDGSGSVYAGANGGGVFRSSNGGASWEPINSGLFTLYTPSLVVGNPAEMYAADFGFGVYKSTNEGTSWDQVNSGMPPSCLLIYKLATDGTGAVYAVGLDCAGGAQLYRSIDGGASWVTPDPTPKAIPISLVADVVDGFDALYAGTFGGLWKSVSRGDGWDDLSPNLPDPNLIVSALAVDSLSPGTVYAGTWGGGVLRSTDGGMTWRSLGLSGQGIVSLLVRPDSGDLYAGTWGQGVLKSTDGGENWVPFNKGIEDTVVLVLANDPVDHTRIYAGISFGSVYQIQDVAPPSASFIPNPYAPGISQEVTFESTSIGAVTEHLWDFGDGHQGSGSSVTHAYSAAGTFSVTLTAVGPGGASTSAPIAVKVSKKPAKRVQVLLLGPTMGAEGTYLSYQAMVSTNLGSSANFLFDWGDKSITGWQPSSSAPHKWSKPGKYRVKARVLGSQGKPSGWSRPVTINITNGSPTILGEHDIESNVPSVYTASPVSTSNAPYRYSFSFDSGATWSAYSPNPTSSHSWSDGGTYCVKVKASDKRGKLSPESDCFYVNVAFSNLPVQPPTPDRGQ